MSVDLVEDPSERATRVHRRLERKWLGSLSVPFSSLYRNARVEGTFRLHSPAVLLGYDEPLPFDFDAGFWDLAVRVVLVIALAGSILGMIVGVVRLVARLTRTW